MKRRGISLNELMVACSLVAILFPLCGKLFWTLANANRTIAQETEERRVLLRLIGQIKRDALEAAEVRNEPSLLLIANDGRRIEYESSESGIERRVTRENELAHRETFRLKSGASLKLTDDPNGDGGYTFVLSGTSGSSGATEELRLTLPTPASRQEAAK